MQGFAVSRARALGEVGRRAPVKHTLFVIKGAELLVYAALMPHLSYKIDLDKGQGLGQGRRDRGTWIETVVCLSW